MLKELGAVFLVDRSVLMRLSSTFAAHPQPRSAHVQRLAPSMVPYMSLYVNSSAFLFHREFPQPRLFALIPFFFFSLSPVLSLNRSFTPPYELTIQMVKHNQVSVNACHMRTRITMSITGVRVIRAGRSPGNDTYTASGGSKGTFAVFSGISSD